MCGLNVCIIVCADRKGPLVSLRRHTPERAGRFYRSVHARVSGRLITLAARRMATAWMGGGLEIQYRVKPKSSSAFVESTDEHDLSGTGVR